MNHRFLILALVGALTLAGCADDAGTDTGGTTPATTTPATTSTNTPTTVTTPDGDGDGDAAAGRALFDDAVANMPPQYGLDMVFDKDGTELMTLRGAFDNESETAFMTITMDPAALGGTGDPSSEELLAEGFSMYMSPDGAYYLVGDMAFVFSGDAASGGFIPSPEESPFAEFTDPNSFLGGGDESDDEDITVNSMEPTTWKGKPAVRMEVESTDEDGETTTGVVIVYTEPRRPAHMEMEIPQSTDEDTGQPDPLSGGTATLDFLYDDEVDVQVPEGAERALGLAYASDVNPFGGPSGQSDWHFENWTFTGDAGIDLAEIEVQVKDDSSGEASSDPTSLSELPTLWSMALADGSATQGTLTLTFHDEDASGTVSAGDRLAIVDESGEKPTVVLYDMVAQRYVVPGPALFALLGALGAAVLLLRRR